MSCDLMEALFYRFLIKMYSLIGKGFTDYKTVLVIPFINFVLCLNNRMLNMPIQINKCVPKTYTNVYKTIKSKNDLLLLKKNIYLYHIILASCLIVDHVVRDSVDII